MIYNIRNQNTDTTKSQKENKTCFNAHAGRSSAGQQAWRCSYLACSYFFTKTKAFVLIKLFLQKKSVTSCKTALNEINAVKQVEAIRPIKLTRFVNFNS